MRSNLEELMRQADPAELYEMPPVTGDRDDSLYASILSRRGINMVKETTDQIGKLEGRAQPRRWSPAIAFAAAFVIVVAAIGLMSLLRSEPAPVVDEPQAPTTTVAPQTTAPATTTPPTTAAAAPATSTTAAAPIAAPVPGIEWVQVDLDPDFGFIFDMAATDYGLIATGARLDPSGDGEIGAVWTSIDGGMTWAELKPGLFFANSAVEVDAALNFVGPIGVAPDGTVVIIAGNVDDFAIWASRDLQTWDNVTSPDFAGPDIQQVRGIAWGGDGFVAVGEDGMSAGVWVSRDGFEWNKVQDEDLLPSEWGAAYMFDVVAGGPGYVAVGSVGFREGTYGGGTSTVNAGASIWVSESGYEWDLLVVDDPGDEGLGSVEVDPATGRLIAFGGDHWYSTDGYDWSWVDRKVPFGGPAMWAQVAWSGNLAVAAGWERSGFSLWVSGDAGDTWGRVDPDLPPFEWCSGALGVVEKDGRFLVNGFTAGSEGCYADLIPALWIGTPQE